MKSWKLVSGILSIVGSLVVFYSSVEVYNDVFNRLAGIYNEVFDHLAGIALILLIAGITSVVTSEGKSLSNIILLILYGIGIVVSLQFDALGPHKENWEGWCLLWGTWCIICALGALIGVYVTSSEKAEDC